MLRTGGARSASGPDRAIWDAWTQRVGTFASLPDLIRELGANSADVVAASGLSRQALANPANRIHYAALGTLLETAAEVTACAHFGLLAGRMWRLRDLGALGDLVRNSKSVGHALQRLAAHQNMNSEGGLAFMIARGEMVDVGYAIYHPAVEHTGQIYDCFLAAGYNFLRELCGPGWSPTEVLLPHAEPPNDVHYRNLFKVRPNFNAEFCAIRFSAHWLERPVEHGDPARVCVVERPCEPPRTRLLNDVYRALRMLLLHGRCSGDDVARMLSMHRRTLNRRLRDQGTTFQEVLDQLRFGVAGQLICESDIRLDDVAATLAYENVTSFMRSFRRWSGTTPGRWRHAASAARHADSMESRRDADGAKSAALETHPG
jgi:AraC-like DNA-binding protein